MTVADEICAALDRANISYFIDRQDIGIGHPFAEIAKAIKECTIFLYLGSRNAYVSKYAPKEVNYAILNKPKNSILPYLIDDTPMPDELEFLLCDYNWRTKREHPVESVLINDLLDLLGRDRVKPETQNKPAEEDRYMIKLISAGVNKLQVVKGIKESLRTGLKEAKDIVDAAPCVFPGDFALNEANSIKHHLEEAGASVLIQPLRESMNTADNYYIMLPSNIRRIETLEAISKYTSISTDTLRQYTYYSPCVLPVLLDAKNAKRIQGEAKLAGIEIELIPFSSKTASVEFKLLSTGDAKLQVVKYLKENLNLGLKEAKDLTDKAPVVVAQARDCRTGIWFANGLTKIGAVVTIQFKA